MRKQDLARSKHAAPVGGRVTFGRGFKHVADVSTPEKKKKVAEVAAAKSKKEGEPCILCGKLPTLYRVPGQGDFCEAHRENAYAAMGRYSKTQKSTVPYDRNYRTL